MSNHNDKNRLNSGEVLPSNVEGNPEPRLHKCIICKTYKEYKDFHKNTAHPTGLDCRCKDCKKQLASTNRTADYFTQYCITKKSECKTKGIHFNLTPEYLKQIWSGLCPIFNIKLEHNKGRGSHHITSSHLDRLVPDLGYVIGNVSWISGRANRIKYNATIEELESILEYMKKK